MKKVLVFASFAPSLLLFRAHLLRDFLNKGCQVSVLAPEITLTEDFKNEFKAKFPAIDILSIDMSLHGMNPIKDFKTIVKLKKLFKQEKPDIVFSYTIKPVIYGSIAASLAKVPSIVAMITGLGTAFQPSSRKDKLIYNLVKFLYRKALNRCQTVIFQNPDDKNLFEELQLVSSKKAVQVNGSGVDLAEFDVAPLPEKIIFLFIGRLLIEKGISEFIQAAEQIHLQYPDVTFRIVGDIFPGHPRSISADDLETLKTKPWFDFVGFVKDVRPYIKKSTVLVLPSYREGTPRSVLEAMATGRPIITTDAPGCRETVLDGANGFLIPVKSVNILVEKMEYFIQNANKCESMGLASRKLAEEKFCVNKVNQIILKEVLGSDKDA